LTEGKNKTGLKAPPKKGGGKKGNAELGRNCLRKKKKGDALVKTFGILTLEGEMGEYNNFRFKIKGVFPKGTVPTSKKVSNGRREKNIFPTTSPLGKRGRT